MSENYPPSAFYFRVAFSSTGGDEDTSFKEVSGISYELETEPYVEGGENRFVHQLPKAVKHPNLVLKRGIASKDSPLVKWCQNVFDNDLGSPIVPKSLDVMLLGADGDAVRSWSFVDAYPVKWAVDGFDSTKNEVAIETIELAYAYSNRVN